MNSLILNGTQIANIYIDASLSYNKPEKRVDSFSVPGRSGDLVVDYGTYKNVVITYPCYMNGNAGAQFNALVNNLSQYKGYQRIECSNDSTHFRLGAVILPKTPTVKMLNTRAFFDLSFNCKPQRYLKSGETVITRTASGVLTNPTAQEARPLIRVYGNGTFSIGDTSVTLVDNTGYTDIDCEMMECYYGTTNRNQNVSFSGNDYPVLKAGTNTLTFGSGITQLQITPRWWEL